jgi:phosphoribosyl 1,2-cyclic phosphodiesterase
MIHDNQIKHFISKWSEYMKITFLGTSAATSCPLPFCHCATCMQARQFGGKDFRKGHQY